MSTDSSEEFLPTWDAPTAPSAACPQCQAVRVPGQAFCPECGYVFPEEGPAGASVPEPSPPQRLRDRYDVGLRLSERDGVGRYHALDTQTGRSVVVIRARPAAPAEPILEPPSSDEVSYAEALTTGEETRSFTAPAWPSLAWERRVLELAQHPSLPCFVDQFSEDGWDYLVEELPDGQPLWDAWDDPEATNELRYFWLKQVAEALQHLHRGGAMPESIRPELVHVNAAGQARLTSLADLLPLPLTPSVPIRGSLYTAPELVLGDAKADARANLYSFGAMLYALLIGRELTETDFERDGVPKPFLTVFPDSHPLLGRLMSKTFCREVGQRFPTYEAQRDDVTGFRELVRALDVCRRGLDQVRLEVAAWTTTGMIRSGNEDAFALLHATSARQDTVEDAALVLLADGMGGSEAGEVAAALAVRTLREQLLQHDAFAALAGREQDESLAWERSVCEERITAALVEANRAVFAAAAEDSARTGMGCTAEVVYIRGRDLLVGHVGDSRTYLYQDGRLVQVTRDQTLVNRMVELGSLTPEEAESHPQRSELLQAIGGRADVEPALYHYLVKPGGWILVCSDGLVNHLTPDDLVQVFQHEAASAESAARRLVNCANLRGGVDNTTVVVVRAL